MAVDSDGEDTLGQLEELISELRASRSRLAHPFRLSNESEPGPWVDEGSGELLRDLTKSAVWSVSTAKAGNGAEQLLDESPETYWQSDGVQPHTITAQFSAKRRVKEVLLYLNFQTDESYTPAAISVRAGSNFHDLRVIRMPMEFETPQGWIRIPLGDENAPNACESPSSESESEDEGAGLGTTEAVRRAQTRDQRHRERENRNRKKRELREKLRIRKREMALEQIDRSYVNAHMVQIVIHCNHQNGRDSHVRMVKVLGTEKQVARVFPKFSSEEFQMYESIR